MVATSTPDSRAGRPCGCTWLLSGIPRSGTSLCCRLASALPGFLAVSEPIGREVSRRAAGKPAGAALVAGQIARIRARALCAGRVPSIQVDGRLDDDRVEAAGAGCAPRRKRGTRDDIAVDANLAPRFDLLVKHNALFAALLPELSTAFPFLAIVRNPLAVLASWQTVDLPVARGRVPAAEQFDPALAATLAGERDVLGRQIAVLNWFFRQYREHLDGDQILRYECLVASGGRTLHAALGHPRQPREPLSSRNGAPAYAATNPQRLLRALARADPAMGPLLHHGRLRRRGGRHRAGMNEPKNAARATARLRVPRAAQWPDALSRTVWFHRHYVRLTGGHVKHAHYFDHVRRLDGHEPVMTFAGTPPSPALRRERDMLWRAGNAVAPHWRPAPRDILFLAGTDWRYLDARSLGDLPNPRIGLVQHVRHAHRGTELHGYLARRAVRICVSEEVADAVRGTRRANGPVVAIPNGTELEPFGRPGHRSHPVAIVAYKRPELGRALSAALRHRGVAHRLLDDFLDRRTFLDLLADTRVAVCLPRDKEGFYLPALEAMAAGCTVVTMDCVGNRGFCRPDDNCLFGTDAASLADAVLHAASMPRADRSAMDSRAAATVARHALDNERAHFHTVLEDIDALWQPPVLKPLPSTRPRPLLDFMIVGAQKCGTTALWQFLGQHPDIGMTSPKECHVFDGESYNPAWSQRDVDVRYAQPLAHSTRARIRGEATPSYLYLPDVAAKLRRYNPTLKLIVALRDPVDRAVSDYYMQKGRGRETRPFWLALLLEPFRLCRDANANLPRSEAREHGYRTRGLYSIQLRNLYQHFPRQRVLIVHSADLRNRHDATLRRVFQFLGVAPDVRIPSGIVFAGPQPRRTHRVARALLRLSYVAETARLRRMTAESPAPADGQPQPRANLSAASSANPSHQQDHRHHE